MQKEEQKMANKLPNIIPGELVLGGFTYPNNAQLIGDFLYVSDFYGNIISGRQVDAGDKITVLDVSYSRQLVLVQYPTLTGVRQGYINNNTKIIKYFWQGKWKNGSSSETVYDGNDLVIGRINPFETATVLYKAGGKIHVVYNTDKGINTKSGYVMYDGSVNSSTVVENVSINNISDKLVSFVASYEGYSGAPYRGVDFQNRTIGYGHVILPGENLTYLTKDEAINLLKKDLQNTAIYVAKLTADIKLSQQQFDALVSFAYNCGVTALSTSTLLKDVKAKQSNDTIKADFLAWSYSNGVKLQGLVNRRLDEWSIYVQGNYLRNS